MDETKRRILLSLIIFSLILSISIVGNAFAKYKTEIRAESVASVALLATDTEISLPVIYSNPGETKIIPFKITNTEDEKPCEVTLKYNFVVSRSNNIPFDYKICKDEHCNMELTPVMQGIYDDESFKLQAGVKDEKTYYLKVSWPEVSNSAYYAFEVDYFTIKVNSEQVD